MTTPEASGRLTKSHFDRRGQISKGTTPPSVHDSNHRSPHRQSPGGGGARIIEGMIFSRSRGWKKVASSISRVATFARVEVRISRFENAVAHPVDLDLREVNEASVEDALAMDTRERIEEFRTFLSRGDRGWYVYRGGQVVHRSWARCGPASVPLWHTWGELRLELGEACIHFCETTSAARGQGIYRSVIARIALTLREEGTRTVWIYTTADNSASRRGIEMAGFVEDRYVEIAVRFGIGTVREWPLIRNSRTQDG
jgi:RimJ/RimL family protein N-acetyltransferase